MRNRVNGSDGFAVNVFDRAFARIAGLLADGNHWGRRTPRRRGGLDITQAELSDTQAGPAVSGSSMAFVRADGVTSEGSLGGMSCGGSYCTARDASFEVFNDGTAECDQNGN